MFKQKINLAEILKCEFTKKDYNQKLKEKRRDFVYRHFKEKIDQVFLDLRKMADDEKSCQYRLESNSIPPYEFSIEVAEGLDPLKTEYVLCCYFRDLEYSTLTETRIIAGKSILYITLT